MSHPPTRRSAPRDANTTAPLITAVDAANERTGSSLRVAVLTEMGPLSPSTRYRALQHVPLLRERFTEVEVSCASDDVRRPPGRTGQAVYLLAHGAHYLQRAAGLPGLLRDRDAVFVQRGLYPLGPGAIVSPLERFHGRVVLDLDDAVFYMDPALEAKSRAAQWLYGPQQARRLCRRAEAVVVSTQTLAEMLPPGSPEPVVMATVPDPRRYQPVVHRERSPARVVWAGTVGGIGFLDPLAEVLRRLSAARLVELVVVSSRAWNGPATFQRWTLESEATMFGSFDIGIMPLPDGPYTRAKAGFKLLQYMAAGLPVIASPIGANRSIVERSGAGLLASSASEWEEALRTLAGDTALRSEMGRRGRLFVESFDVPSQAATIARLLAG